MLARLVRKRLIVLAAFCAWACLSSAYAQSFRVGIIAGLTGPGATYGAGIREGAIMAAEEVNEAGGAGGRKIELVVVDDATSPARSVIAMQRLAQDQVDIVIGGWGSSQVLANMVVPELRGIPYIVVGATHPSITTSHNRWTFRVIQSDEIQTNNLAEFAVGKRHLRRLAVINDSNEYGTANRDIFAAALKNKGIEPTDIESYQTGSVDFRQQVGNMLDTKPDAIALFGTVPAAPRIIAQIRSPEMVAKFPGARSLPILGTGGLSSEDVITMAAGAADGTVFTSVFDEQSDATASAWAERFRKRFADEPVPAQPIAAAWEYRALKSIAAPCLASLLPTEDTRIALRDCIRSWRGNLLGIAGEVHFDESGQLVQPPLLVEIRNGKFEPLN